METYRFWWLSICVLLGVIGTTVALAVSPAAVSFLFVVSGAIGSLLTLCLVSGYWELGAGGRLRLLAGGGWSQEPASAPSSGLPPCWARVSSCSQPWSWRDRRTR